MQVLTLNKFGLTFIFMFLQKNYKLCKMYTLTFKIIFTLYLKCYQIVLTYVLEEKLEQLIDNSESESASWPLQAGYPGLHIKNLNEYVSLFSHCLVNIQNYQGIEIIGIKSPVYLTRFDVADLYWDLSKRDRYHDTSRFFFGRIPQKSARDGTTNYYRAIKYTDKSFNARWYCTAQFDLFFPEPTEAPHIVFQSQRSGVSYPYRLSDDRSIFDIASEYITTLKDHREDWSK